MELILEVVSSERFMLGDNASHRFLPAGGVIGRSSECDWMIPDQTRHLSGRHAIVSYESGQFFITDISTNGIYLNGPDALPKNVAVPLQDEDRVMMGEHQFRVQVRMDVRPSVSTPVNRPQASPPPLGKSGFGGGAPGNPMDAVDAFVADRSQQDSAARQQNEWHQKSDSMPDNLRPEREAFVPPSFEPPLPVQKPSMSSPPMSSPPPQQPPAEVQGLPDNWMDLSVVPSVVSAVQAPSVSGKQPAADPVLPTVEGPATGYPPPVIPRPGKPPAAQRNGSDTLFEPPSSMFATSSAPVPPAPPESLPVRPVAPMPPVAPVQSSGAMAAFAEGLGLTADDIAKAGGDEFMKRAGALLRQSLQGMVSSAHTRASLKNEFRLDMTLVNPRANNPIKFSAHGDQVVRHLLSKDSGSFLTVEDAVQECNIDFQHHQLAMMAGMQHAFLELIQQLSPDELERRFERLKNKGITFSSKGARYWDAYRELHQELQEEDDIFASMFVEPFARAYDEQIEKLKQNSKKKEK